MDPLLNQVIKTEVDVSLCFIVTRSYFPPWTDGSLGSNAFGCSKSGELHHWSELESTELMIEVPVKLVILGSRVVGRGRMMDVGLDHPWIYLDRHCWHVCSWSGVSGC